MGERLPVSRGSVKAVAFSDAVDVVERLRDPTDPSTERTAPPCSAMFNSMTSLALLI